MAIYRPSHFFEKEQKDIVEIVQNYSFATVISADEQGLPFISHIPVIAEVSGDQITKLKGHFAIRNPQVQKLRTQNIATVIFQGPHTYITPKWYRSGRDVPTWNYCVVHVSGRLKLTSDFKELCNILKESTNKYEVGSTNWRFELPEDLENPTALTSAIIGFELIPDKIEAKFKLSQNRQQIDKDGIIEGLQTRTDEQSRLILNWMTRPK